MYLTYCLVILNFIIAANLGGISQCKTIIGILPTNSMLSFKVIHGACLLLGNNVPIVQ